MSARHRRLLALPLAAACLTSCVEPSSPAAATAPPTVAAHDVDLPGYGLGTLRRATPGSPCAAGASRQFDLWVGDWIVPNPNGGDPNATNSVTVDLDGCAVLEHWTPRPSAQNPLAPRGRSLNAYDAETGQWHQTWIPEGSFPAGGVPFRMAGGLRADGVMAMEGTRFFWANGEPWIDRYTWTKVDDDHVVQAFTFERPWRGVKQSGAVPYTRAATLPVFASPGNHTNCRAGGISGETRALDFTVGRWTVRAENGLALGESEIAVDPTLSGCLIEERFTGAKGYRAIGWLYYDPIENRYYRSYVDSEGEWMELRGAPVVNPLVLEGSEAVDGAPDAMVRLTWTPESPDRLRQRWEVSTDTGATWRTMHVLVFERS